MAKDKLVKLGEQYFNLSVKNGKFDIQEVKTEDAITKAFEMQVLDTQNDPNANKLQNVMTEAREEVLRTLKDGIKDTVLSCLGFERNSWGKEGFKVDHCNGRMSKVTEYIAFEVKALLKDLKPEDISLSETEKADIAKEFKKELLKEYRSKIRNDIYSQASEMAKVDASKLAKQLYAEKSKDVAELLLEQLTGKSGK